MRREISSRIAPLRKTHDNYAESSTRCNNYNNRTDSSPFVAFVGTINPRRLTCVATTIDVRVKTFFATRRRWLQLTLRRRLPRPNSLFCNNGSLVLYRPSTRLPGFDSNQKKTTNRIASQPIFDTFFPQTTMAEPMDVDPQARPPPQIAATGAYLRGDAWNLESFHPNRVAELRATGAIVDPTEITPADPRFFDLAADSKLWPPVRIDSPVSFDVPGSPAETARRELEFAFEHEIANFAVEAKDFPHSSAVRVFKFGADDARLNYVRDRLPSDVGADLPAYRQPKAHEFLNSVDGQEKLFEAVVRDVATWRGLYRGSASERAELVVFLDLLGVWVVRNRGWLLCLIDLTSRGSFRVISYVVCYPVLYDHANSYATFFDQRSDIFRNPASTLIAPGSKLSLVVPVIENRRTLTDGVDFANNPQYVRGGPAVTSRGEIRYRYPVPAAQSSTLERTWTEELYWAVIDADDGTQRLLINVAEPHMLAPVIDDAGDVGMRVVGHAAWFAEAIPRAEASLADAVRVWEAATGRTAKTATARNVTRLRTNKNALDEKRREFDERFSATHERPTQHFDASDLIGGQYVVVDARGNPISTAVFPGSGAVMLNLLFDVARTVDEFEDSAQGFESVHIVAVPGNAVVVPAPLPNRPDRRALERSNERFYVDRYGFDFMDKGGAAKLAQLRFDYVRHARKQAKVRGAAARLRDRFESWHDKGDRPMTARPQSSPYEAFQLASRWKRLRVDYDGELKRMLEHGTTRHHHRVSANAILDVAQRPRVIDVKSTWYAFLRNFRSHALHRRVAEDSRKAWADRRDDATVYRALDSSARLMGVKDGHRAVDAMMTAGAAMAHFSTMWDALRWPHFFTRTYESDWNLMAPYGGNRRLYLAHVVRDLATTAREWSGFFYAELKPKTEDERRLLSSVVGKGLRDFDAIANRSPATDVRWTPDLDDDATATFSFARNFRNLVLSIDPARYNDAEKTRLILLASKATFYESLFGPTDEFARGGGLFATTYGTVRQMQPEHDDLVAAANSDSSGPMVFSEWWRRTVAKVGSLRDHDRYRVTHLTVAYVVNLQLTVGAVLDGWSTTVRELIHVAAWSSSRTLAYLSTGRIKADHRDEAAYQYGRRVYKATFKVKDVLLQILDPRGRLMHLAGDIESGEYPRADELASNLLPPYRQVGSEKSEAIVVHDATYRHLMLLRRLMHRLTSPIGAEGDPLMKRYERWEVPLWMMLRDVPRFFKPADVLPGDRDGQAEFKRRQTAKHAWLWRLMIDDGLYATMPSKEDGSDVAAWVGSPIDGRLEDDDEDESDFDSDFIDSQHDSSSIGKEFSEAAAPCARCGSDAIWVAESAPELRYCSVECHDVDFPY